MVDFLQALASLGTGFMQGRQMREEREQVRKDRATQEEDRRRRREIEDLQRAMYEIDLAQKQRAAAPWIDTPAGMALLEKYMPMQPGESVAPSGIPLASSQPAGSVLNNTFTPGLVSNYGLPGKVSPGLPDKRMPVAPGVDRLFSPDATAAEVAEAAKLIYPDALETKQQYTVTLDGKPYTGSADDLYKLMTGLAQQSKAAMVPKPFIAEIKPNGEVVWDFDATNLVTPSIAASIMKQSLSRIPSQINVDTTVADLNRARESRIQEMTPVEIDLLRSRTGVNRAMVPNIDARTAYMSGPMTDLSRAREREITDLLPFRTANMAADTDLTRSRTAGENILNAPPPATNIPARLIPTIDKSRLYDSQIENINAKTSAVKQDTEMVEVKVWDAIKRVTTKQMVPRSEADAYMNRYNREHPIPWRDPVTGRTVFRTPAEILRLSQPPATVENLQAKTAAIPIQLQISMQNADANTTRADKAGVKAPPKVKPVSQATLNAWRKEWTTDELLDGNLTFKSKTPAAMRQKINDAEKALGLQVTGVSESEIPLSSTPQIDNSATWMKEHRNETSPGILAAIELRKGRTVNEVQRALRIALGMDSATSYRYAKGAAQVIRDGKWANMKKEDLEKNVKELSALIEKVSQGVQ